MTRVAPLILALGCAQHARPPRSPFDPDLPRVFDRARRDALQCGLRRTECEQEADLRGRLLRACPGCAPLLRPARDCAALSDALSGRAAESCLEDADMRMNP